jgi:hypothetical protein
MERNVTKASKTRQWPLLVILILLLGIVWWVAALTDQVTWPTILQGFGEFIKLGSITFTGAYLGFHFAKTENKQGWLPVAIIVFMCLLLFSIGAIFQTIGTSLSNRQKSVAAGSKLDDTPSTESYRYSKKYEI